MGVKHMGQLEGKVGLVTGASGGLGKSIALALAEAGANVVIASRSEKRLEEVRVEVEKKGADCLVVPTDVSKESDVKRLFEKTRSHFSRLDLLVNNAGLAIGGASHELSFEIWRQVMDVNLDGAFLCGREALAIMRGQGNGRVINIGSVSAKVPRPHSAPYTASKFALEGLTKAMALDAREYGVSVSILHPGNTDTPIWDPRREQGEAEGLMCPDQLARLVVTMAALPSDINFLEGLVLPVSMPFLGRG
jgi:NAD(P)-dependent dehydrogenase (short-subunit alcohol dehydrogenase family)